MVTDNLSTPPVVVNTFLSHFPGSDFLPRMIPLDGKIPRAPWKVYLDRPPTIEEYVRWSHDYPGCNWGILTGFGFVVIDTDNEEEEAIVTSWKLPPTFTVRTGRGKHRYYRTNDVIRCQRLSGVLLKGVGGYVVVPGSTHANGNAYAVLDPVPPAWLGETALPRLSGPSRGTRKHKKPTTGRSRSEIEQSLICRLLRQGKSTGAIFRYFADPENPCKKFQEMFVENPENGHRWLSRSIASARDHLAAHDIRRGQAITHLSEIRNKLLTHSRRAVRYLWEKLIDFARRYGILTDDDSHISFTASKRQLGDTAYRAFSALAEKLIDLGADLIRIPSKRHPKGRIASTYLLSIVSYGEMAVEADLDVCVINEISPTGVEEDHEEAKEGSQEGLRRRGCAQASDPRPVGLVLGDDGQDPLPDDRRVQGGEAEGDGR